MKNSFDSMNEAELIDQLKSMEVTPPVGLWNEIDATLIAKSRRRIVIISSWASAATIALLISIGSVLYLQTKFESPKTYHQVDKSSVSSIKNDKAISSLTPNSKDQSREILESKHLPEQKNTFEPSIEKANLVPSEIVEKLTLPELLSARKPSLQSVKIIDHERLLFPKSYNKNINQSIAFAESSVTKTKGKWYISLSGFPVYSFHSAGAMNKVGTQQQSGIVSWGGTISARYEFAKRLSIETGIIYSIMGQQEKDLYLVYSDTKNVEVYNNSSLTNYYGTLEVPNSEYTLMDIDDVNKLSYDAVNESNFNKVDAIQRFRYIELPIIISKGFYYKGFNFFLRGGVSAGILTQNLLELKGSNISLKGKTDGVDHYTASAITSIGLTIPILSKVNLLIEPTFKLGLKSLSSLKGKSYPFSSYIKFGIEIPI